MTKSEVRQQEISKVEFLLKDDTLTGRERYALLTYLDNIEKEGEK